MEELLQHCMRELAFDGDLGCDVSRLRHFIQSFYASQQPSSNQNVDDAFHTFVWALLVRQPSVRVGLVPEGHAHEVYIAPQRSKIKAVTKPKKKLLMPEPAQFPASDGRDGYSVVTDDSTELFPGRLQPIPEAVTSSLESLVKKYGGGLRVAVDPETCFRAITGTHIRPAKLSPMVYTALQFISRGREAGLSVVDLGKKTGYDQKTCFYVISQLLSMDLVVKFAKGGSGGGNFCIHKYFYSQSAFWKSVRREEHIDEEENVGGNTQHGEQPIEHEDSTGSHAKLHFQPIDSRHLASTELIKSRVVKLLKNSENGLHLYYNLLVAIGFIKPTKQDRRFFNLRIRELIKDHIIEKVIVPKLHGSSSTVCIRLVADPRNKGAEGIVVQPGDVGDEEPEGPLEDRGEDVTSMPVANMTIHRQVLKLLERAGAEGLTLSDISTRLGNFDKRTLEQLLHRLERIPPPSHLADLATCEFLENQGRERRHRYYTLMGYLSFIRNENIDDAGDTSRYTSTDISQSGGFYIQDDHQFYKDYASLIKFQDEFIQNRKPPKEGPPRKPGRPRKNASNPSIEKPVAQDEITNSTVKPRGKKAKAARDPQEGGDKEQLDTKIIKKGTKRKRINDPEPVASTSEFQVPPKKKRIVKKTSAQEQDHLADISKAAAVQVPEPPNSSHAETVTVFQPKTLFRNASPSNTGIQNCIELGLAEEAHMEEPGLSPSQNNANTSLNMSHEVPVLSLVDSTVSQGSGGTPSTLVNGSKRSSDTLTDTLPNVEQHPAKRPKRGRPKQHRANISQLRAENEIMRVVDKSGGIANMSTKEFWETYAHIISSMVEAGEPTSMPIGTQPDRRTINKLLERLVDRGKLKILTATLIPRVTQPRLAKLIYEPSVSQERLDQFLSALREDVPTPSIPLYKQLDQPMHFTRPKPRRAYDVVFTGDGGSDSQDKQRHGIGLSGEDDHATRSGFQSEAQVAAQLYGYLMGKARRARELHQFTLSQLESSEPSSYIVSRTERIVAFPYFFHELPVSTYCAIVSVTTYSLELSHLMMTSEGRQTPVSHLSPSLDDRLKIGRSAARGKILKLLDILTALKLVTPLQPSDSTTPYLSCDPNGAHPVHFDIAPTAKEKGTVTMTESYWHFKSIAPIYLYSQSNSWPLPFHRDMFIRTANESMPFWRELEDSFLKNHCVVPEASLDSITGPCVCPPRLVRSLRKTQSWVSTYVLSWSQKQYLKQRWTNPLTGYTPLSNQDGGGDRLEHICNIISAPLDAVYSFFVTITDFFTKQAARIAEKNKLRQTRFRDLQTAEGRVLLAKKAAEARQQLESDWDALVSRVHSSPLSHGSSINLESLRVRYLNSRAFLTVQQWESAITEAVSVSKSGQKIPPVLPSLRSSPRRPSLRTRESGLLPVASEQQKSVTELIERYKDKMVAGQMTLQKKKGTDTHDNADLVSTTMTELPRRQRFQWTPEYDELARDASAVIRARCRSWNRMDWTALNQLFPFLLRNSARQRIATLRQEAGGEAYLRLLEDKWHELWLDHRGTEELPDDNPDHPSDFNAIEHIEFLRKYIDKQALRSGLSTVTASPVIDAILTKNASDFLSKWNLGEQTRPTLEREMKFMWSSIGDEHREKALLGEAFSTTHTTQSSLLMPPSNDALLNGVAESALKMTLTTLDEDYDARDASVLLDGVGQQNVHQASKDLSSRGVISQIRNNHRKAPGRKLKISDLNEEALGGSFRSEFFLDACAIEDNIEDDGDWREWPLLATDGEMATFIELVSGGKIEFQIDVSEASAHRQDLDWNSKKVDDDQIETSLTMRCLPLSYPPESPPTSPKVDIELDGHNFGDHGFNNGVPAPCRRLSKGIITCMACITEEQSDLLAVLEPEERDLCLDIIEKLDLAGRDGLSYNSIILDPQRTQSIRTIIRHLTSSKHPLSYWVGYSHPVLVSRRHIRDWTVSLPGPLHFVFPRRWLNIRGEQMNEVWNAGLRAVVGVLVARPGIPQAELRQRLVSVYDRQELNDLLEYLWTAEMIVRRTEDETTSEDIREVGGAQERNVYWSLSASAWYHVNE